MRTQRAAEYKGILVELNHAQVEALDEMKAATGRSRVDLVREAIAMLIGSYRLAQMEKHDGVKVA